MLFTEKYRPRTGKEVIGQELAVKKINSFLSNLQSKKPLLLYGSVGTGKTSSVYALANELDLEVFELNASDKRNKEQIEHLIKNASSQLSLFNKGKVILIEEIDGISGRQDRGAINSLMKIMESCRFPIIFTTNDLELEKIQPLMKKVEIVKFLPLGKNDVLKVLEDICKKEKIKYSEKDLLKLSRNKDLRAAINDLQSSIVENKLKVAGMDRDLREKMQQVLTVIFKGKNAKVSYDILDNLDHDLIDYSSTRSPVVFGNDDAYSYWIEENLPREYSTEDMAGAYDIVSKSDVFRGRILRRQHWRFLIYLGTLLSSGITLSKKNRNPSIIEYKKTRRSPKQNRKLWFMVNRKKKDIAEKIAEITHKSRKEVMKELPYYKIISRRSKIPEFKLTEEELSYLKK